MMRTLTPVLLTAMIASFVGIVALRHEGDAAPHPTAGSAAATPTTTPASTAAKPAPKADAKPVALARPLRTVALGWELLAPGVIANDATSGSPSAFKAKNLEVGFANAATVDEIESALAKGGGEATGADIAIMPLSSFVASYERLRALSPEIVFVVGWSRGREALYGTTAAALAKLPASGTIKLAATAGRPESFLALFLLDLAGTPASRVELVAPGTPAPLTAAFRSGKSRPAGKLLVTSADTPFLMPMVAVAPHGFVATHGHDLETWARVWLDGVARLQADVPSGGRLLAAQPGAPPVVGIIEALGQIEFASLRENAVAAGLSGRGALTLDDSFRTTWRIWRDAGVLTTPPPELAPLDPTTIAALVRTDRAEAEQPARTAANASSGDKRPEVLLVVRGPSGKADADAWVTRVGFIAAVFDRLPLRLKIDATGKLAQQVADTTRERYNLRAGHVVAGKAAVPAIEILSAR